MGIKNGVPDSNLQGDHTPVKESWLVNLSDYNLNYKSVCSDPRLRKDFAAELANIKRVRRVGFNPQIKERRVT